VSFLIKFFHFKVKGASDVIIKRQSNFLLAVEGLIETGLKAYIDLSYRRVYHSLLFNIEVNLQGGQVLQVLFFHRKESPFELKSYRLLIFKTRGSGHIYLIDSYMFNL